MIGETMPDLIPPHPPASEPINPFGLLSPVVQEMVSTVSVLQRAIVEERQQHAMALAQKDAEHAAEVRGLTARLEAVEAEIEACRRDPDRGWTGHPEPPDILTPLGYDAALAAEMRSRRDIAQSGVLNGTTVTGTRA